jgi:hypothetical protein
METMLQAETRALTRRLIAYEAVAGKSFEPKEPAAFRVYDKLRRQLCALAGVAGFQSLVSRALTIAEREAPSLGAVQVMPDGSLTGLVKFVPPAPEAEGEVILIAEVIGLLLTFLGEALTLRLVQDVWPDVAFDDGDSRMGRRA